MGSSTSNYGITGYYLRSAKITSADSGTVAKLDIPAKTFIPPFGVSLVITTAFSGGTPSIDIGDGADADGWVDTDNITETTAAAYSGTVAAGAAYIFAYCLPVDDVIDD